MNFSTFVKFQGGLKLNNLSLEPINVTFLEPKAISRKIYLTENSSNFPHCAFYVTRGFLTLLGPISVISGNGRHVGFFVCRTGVSQMAH